MEKYALVTLILIIASFIYLKLAIKYKIIDKPNERSSHTKITVRGGGIIFTIAILLFYLFNDYQYPYFLLGVLIISIISFLDDILTLSSKIRFPFQFLSVFLILYQIGFPFSPIYLFFFALIFGVGIVNMFNFMDGINGITGLYSLSSLLGLYLINSQENIVNSDIIIYSAISLLIFGFFNFRKKALFFAGDIGSITIGMLIFFIGLYFTYVLESPLILLTVIVYGADASNTLIYRKFYTNESIFEAHRHHIYQKLVHKKKISHIKVSLIYALIQIIVNLIVYKSYSLDLQTQILIFISLVSLFIFMYVFLFQKLKIS
mgnify:CR=1 FL=1